MSTNLTVVVDGGLTLVVGTVRVVLKVRVVLLALVRRIKVGEEVSIDLPSINGVRCSGDGVCCC